ncbi:MAG: Por secretion system protein, partial [Prevotella sp.]|nr:Por secretion system protein [Prevotella sp.]
MKKVVVALFLLISSIQSSMCQIGTWHNYLAYHDIQQIQAAGNDLFVMASNALDQDNQQDQRIRTYDKVNGLSDTHITHIRWCQQA